MIDVAIVTRFVLLIAVDAHVGSHLFEKCVMELKRRGKLVLLVTNALQFLRRSDHILVVREGRAVEEGTYQQLLSSGTVFQDMISTMKDSSSSSTKVNSNSVGVDTTTVNGTVTPTDTESVTGTDSSTIVVHTVPVTTTNSNDQTEKTSITVTNNRDNSNGNSNGNKKKLSTSAASNAAGNLISTEDRVTGSVGTQVYSKWAMAAGGVSVTFVMFFLYYLAEGVTVLASWWLSFWSEHRYSNTSPWYYLGESICHCHHSIYYQQ